LLLHLHVDHLNDGDTTINGSTLQRGELPVLSSLLCCMYKATILWAYVPWAAAEPCSSLCRRRRVRRRRVPIHAVEHRHVEPAPSALVDSTNVVSRPQSRWVAVRRHLMPVLSLDNGVRPAFRFKKSLTRQPRWCTPCLFWYGASGTTSGSSIVMYYVSNSSAYIWVSSGGGGDNLWCGFA
jgi:hypothetical protein